jgi:hypothetical protein
VKINRPSIVPNFAENRQLLDPLAEDNRLNVYAGKLEVRPPGAPTAGPRSFPTGESRRRARFRAGCGTEGQSVESWQLFNHLVVMVRWRMSNQPWDPAEKHQQHRADENPELNGRVLVPLEPTQAFPRSAVDPSALRPTEMRAIR